MTSRHRLLRKQINYNDAYKNKKGLVTESPQSHPDRGNSPQKPPQFLSDVLPSRNSKTRTNHKHIKMCLMSHPVNFNDCVSEFKNRISRERRLTQKI